MNQVSIGTLSSSAQIWDSVNVYMNKILRKKWSYIIEHNRKGGKD